MQKYSLIGFHKEIKKMHLQHFGVCFFIEKLKTLADTHKKKLLMYIIFNIFLDTKYLGLEIKI